ncbi:deoxyribodipyrimidine photo-lyase [Chloroflexus sp. Y-396-1]|uniref:cryptochrome/photolyase family protein n=1 Tax=Chloroflexus sp. Y-396-1 TaxID=867845 RepID=UPI00048DDE34|nr:deoxyribodipyrimidine photo-lyase [Chloroflexus sp. Y-396-1]
MLIHWFRRDLRLRDNTALMAAAYAAGGAVVPVFIFDDAILGGRFASPARTQFLLDCLAELDAELRTFGLHLVVRRGEPLSELITLLRETGATGVTWNRDYTPYAIRRDRAIKQSLRAAGYSAQSYKDAVIFEMDEVVTAEGRPYTVYTPYAKRWRARLATEPVRVQGMPTLAAIPLPPGIPLPQLTELLPDAPTELPRFPAGETVALAALDRFVRGPLTDYAQGRDRLAIAGTSRLSPYLRMGVLSPRQCIAAALNAPPGPGPESWIGELIWRDFYVQVLYHFPHALRGSFKPVYDRIAWPNDPTLFAAWQQGQTGYPIVDAAMRQLQREGWMHNRARMIVASFLTKDLLVDWRWGERHFMHLLIDGDPAANNGGWQWAAGTGTDAQPYFRIFNPVSQGQKFDPDGAYVRRYVPELARVPVRYIHEPHTMPLTEQIKAGVQIGRDYPAPIVDHATQRKRALELYRAVRHDNPSAERYA